MLKVFRGGRGGRTALLAASATVLTGVAAVTATPATASSTPAAQGGAQLGGHGIVVNYPARGARKLPSVPAHSYLIADATTGQVLAAKDPHGHWAPASTAHPATPAATPTATRPAAAHHVAKLAKASGFPAAPVAVGGSLLVATVLIAAGIVLARRVRRQRRGGSPPGP